MGIGTIHTMQGPPPKRHIIADWLQASLENSRYHLHLSLVLIFSYPLPAVDPIS
jgi:hypothetical protein